jgi:hypothetical protein
MMKRPSLCRPAVNGVMHVAKRTGGFDRIVSNGIQGYMVPSIIISIATVPACIWWGRNFGCLNVW